MLPLEASGSGPFGPLLPHDPVEFYVGIALLVVVFTIIAKVVVPKFEATYEARRLAIEGGMEEAAAAEAAANAKLAEYSAKLESADEEAAAIRENARVQSAQIISESRAKANAESERILDQAAATVEAQRQQAEQQLRTQVGEIATTLAGKIVGEALDEERSRRTVDRFLAQLEAEHA